MSFSAEVKEELARNVSPARHCEIAELSAIIQFCGQIFRDEKGHWHVKIQTENHYVAKKCFTLWKKTFTIYSSVCVRCHMRAKKVLTYILQTSSDSEARQILETLKLPVTESQNEMGVCVSPLLLKNSCCKRAYLRGVYLAAGSMSDPDKSYHLEFVCQREEQAHQLVSVLAAFELEAKIVLRKKYYVVYFKEGEGIVEILGIMEAHVALMELENTRILKEMRNSINRRVNCETANIAKTVSAATKQTEDIIYIRDHYGFGNLPANLAQMAQIRLANPDATLKELGELADPPIGKSGVNHRLRKLGELADKLRS
ncbi:MAG: DNA-binding protein WhiA [Lachnospiraceae bacterium]|jgi:hypothetical protein|nr:DNA-binding protein WhiA [Lachnospiraceae bacterium]